MGRIVKGIRAVGKDGEGEVNVLFDTGADADLISDGAAKRLGDSKFRDKFIIKLPDGTEVATDRMAMVMLHLNGCRIPIPAPVLPGLEHDIIIGNRTMQAHEMRLDMPGEAVHIGRCKLRI